MKEFFGTKYQMIEQRWKHQSYKADRRPYAKMMVEKYQATRFDHKFFVIGFLIGLVPYIVHMKF
tara:strand:+ start:567 stop:758 length:192 start_codon:yes stop_codon:yes gene_type:complete